ncbi:MAG TPA: GNAT family N-acetyltransferase [Ktedonobacterales bacterium]|nr:GNAT family N-acetyltransferase [Ktedonobacterales bacterium]
MPEIRMLPRRSDAIRQAASTLDRAFFDDPLFAYLLPNPAQRKRLLSRIHLIMVRYGLRYGAVYAPPEREGIACWLSPGNTTPTFWRLLAVAWRTPPLALGVRGYRRYARLNAYLEQTHARVAPGAHWYLWALGVDPACQRQGLGSQLLQPILAQADRDRGPCYLETMQITNLAFYERHGFRVVSDGVAPGTALRVWGMRRGDVAHAPGW